MSLPTILQVLHSLDVGGAEKMAVSLADSLRDRYEFVYFCLDRGGTLSEELDLMGVSTVIGERHGAFDIGLARRLRAVCRKSGASLIHAHQYTPFFYALLSRMGGSSPPILFTEHGRFHPDSRDGRRVLINRSLMRRGDRVAAVGNNVATAVVDYEGIRPGRIETVYNGVALDRFLNPVPGKQEARRDLGLDSDEILVLMVARLDPIKDHGTAIEAVARASRRCDRVRLLIVGDGEQRGPIEGLVHGHTAGVRIDLLGERKDIDLLMKAADILLLTSVSEGIPLVLIEGMASRLPIVATSVGGVPEVVRDEREGLLCPVGDSTSIGNAILRLAADPELRARLGSAGKASAMARFSIETMAESYVSLYERLRSKLS